MSNDHDFRPACPIPISDYPQILMAHGGGGRLMHQLIGKIFRSAFGASGAGAGAGTRVEEEHDGAVLEVAAGRMAFTTDSYVVRPLFFPGGDIGSLAVNGTVNDLAMCGARPRWLSAGFIIEEGLEMEALWRVARSMGEAARRAGVRIVTGDTKVVDKGKGDGLFVNTAGVGEVAEGRDVRPGRIAGGDVVIVNGDLGRHGIAIMSAREGLEFESAIESDCAGLGGAVEALFAAGVDVHCLRDCTRGGFATTLVELAQSSRRRIVVEEAALSVDESVRGACEILGLDPLYVANEGRFVAVVPGEQAERAVEALRGAGPTGEGAVVVGRVEEAGGDGGGGVGGGRVLLRSVIGAMRVLDMLSGEQLPRIC